MKWHKQKRLEEQKTGVPLRSLRIKQAQYTIPSWKTKRKPCKACGMLFKAEVAMLYCMNCRVDLLSLEATHKAPYTAQEIKDWEYKRRDEVDFRIIDENGTEVWASDLAERYRSELRRRQRYDFRELT